MSNNKITFNNSFMKMKRKMTIVPYGGLCNRLFFINSMNKYARENELSLECVWLMNEELYINVYDLFDIDSDIISIKIYDTKKILPWIYQFFYKIFRRLNIFLINQLKFYDRKDIEKSNESFIANISTHHIVTGCQSFYNEYTENIFVIKDKYYKKADGVMLNCEKKKLVSIHVRRTDHSDAIKFSSDDKIYAIIEKEIKNKNKVFIACDDLNFKKKLVDIYGDCIITQNVLSVNRDSSISIEYALIDLICLSRGKVLYGSYNSTFSLFAAYLGGSRFVVIM